MQGYNAEKTRYYDRACEDMVGKKYGKLTVTEYVGLVERSIADPARIRKVKTVCECGREQIVSASEVRTGHRTSCAACKDVKAVICRKRFIKKPTLCWRCKKSTNRLLCPWAGGVPRDDWEARRTTICEKNQAGGITYDRKVESYIVISCPAFEEG